MYREELKSKKISHNEGRTVKTEKSGLPKKTTPEPKASVDSEGMKLYVKIPQKTGALLTGCKEKSEGSYALSEMVMRAASNANSVELVERQTKEYLAIIKELAPRDPFEGMLVSQMFLVFRQALQVFSLLNLNENKSRTDIQDSLTNRHTKLMRLFNQQLETLDKHRRGGNQKMTVEHVHVHEGGKAIVGSVTQGGGGKDEK